MEFTLGRKKREAAVRAVQIRDDIESDEEKAEYVNPFGKTLTTTANRSSKASIPAPEHRVSKDNNGRNSGSLTSNNASNTSLPYGRAALDGKAPKEPLSVEEALRIRKQQAEPDRPVFLSKQQRAQAALERRQREADEMRRRREVRVQELSATTTDSGKNEEYMRESGERRPKQSRRDSRSPARHRRQYHDRDEPRGSSRRAGRHPWDSESESDDDYKRKSGRGSGGGDFYRPSSRPHNDRARSRSPPATPQRQTADAKDEEAFEYIGNQSTDGTGDRVLTHKEREAIRRRYLVGDQASSRSMRKQGSRKVVFDWDASEDTSRDISDLYENRHHFHQLFGRGHVAGVDEAEQERLRKGGSSKKSALRGSASFSAAVEEGIDGISQEDRERMQRIRERRRQREIKTKWDERHWSEKPKNEMRDRDWRIFREDYSISCKGGSIPHPYRSWDESNIPDSILRAVDDVGYQEPTPIQRQAIPIGLQNRDLIGIAETGSGKTASFLIPMLAFIMTQPRLTERNMADGPYALILAPTRELAQQIEAEALKFARRLGFHCVSIVGGHDIEKQAFALRNGAEIVIATPGRLRDCLGRRVLVLNQCTYVVMDEADRMMDMGFEDDVNFILSALPVSNRKPDDYEGSSAAGDGFKFRQTTMFSATMPPAVERIAHKFLRKPATVTIGTAGKAVDTVEQRAEFVTGDEKRKQRLLGVLRSHSESPPFIVFVNQKKNVDLLGAELMRTNYAVVTLHGGKTQEQREQALAKLRSGDADILVATDVAGRGIDVKDVSLVVNYDMAKDIESYTHRIGRTGRAGKRGLAITFLNPTDDRDVLYDLRKMIAASPVSRCPPELANHAAAQAPPSLVKAAAAAAAK
ncbi:mRNA splicing protein prp28 [Coemansia sp. RSA 1939]|nr:mRNA splicing protein prp28 [Coemansia sp. RSA 1939]KAJ2614818.1 mRNA splicing protein prp28 [Coemansia sp. RSA 1804]